MNISTFAHSIYNSLSGERCETQIFIVQRDEEQCDEEGMKKSFCSVDPVLRIWVEKYATPSDRRSQDNEVCGKMRESKVVTK
jgi:hypothetical protein